MTIASCGDQFTTRVSTLASTLASTQTAAVLTELADEAGQSQLSHDDILAQRDYEDIKHCVEAAGYGHTLQVGIIHVLCHGSLVQSRLVITRPVITWIRI